MFNFMMQNFRELVGILIVITTILNVVVTRLYIKEAIEFDEECDMLLKTVGECTERIKRFGN